jgi:ATP-dependent Lon protease
VILPKQNEKDLEEIPEEVRQALEIHLVESMDEVLSLALESKISPLPKADPNLGKAAPGNPGSVAH